MPQAGSRRAELGARLRLQEEKKEKTGKGVERRSSAPGQGPLGSQLCVQLLLSIPTTSPDIRFPAFHRLGDTEPCDPLRGFRGGSSPSNPASSNSPRERARGRVRQPARGQKGALALLIGAGEEEGLEAPHPP